MLEAQAFHQEDIDISKPINFAPRELKFFKDELDKQFTEGNGVDLSKALRNARYLAMLDRGFRQLENGYGHFHELIEVDDE